MSACKTNKANLKAYNIFSSFLVSKYYKVYIYKSRPSLINITLYLFVIGFLTGGRG